MCQAKSDLISEVKGSDLLFDYTTAAVTVSPESGALSCVADLPGDSALCAVSVPRIRSGAGLAHRFALGLPCLRQTSPPEADKLQTVPGGNALAFG